MVGVIILAGGKGNRIGGHKPFIKLNDRFLISHVLEKIRKISDETVIVTSNDFTAYFKELVPRNIVVLSDLVAGRGPLIGLYTGLKFVKSDQVLVLPCDSPFLNECVIQYLVRKSVNMNAVIPIWPNGYIEPLHSVYRVSATLEACETVMQQNSFKISRMIKELDRVSFIPVDELRPFDPNLLSFININTEQDFQKAIRNQIKK
jgi:molybdopterin-guanine dinucleotide biosynthesis protein A